MLRDGIGLRRFTTPGRCPRFRSALYSVLSPVASRVGSIGAQGHGSPEIWQHACLTAGLWMAYFCGAVSGAVLEKVTAFPPFCCRAVLVMATSSIWCTPSRLRMNLNFGMRANGAGAVIRRSRLGLYALAFVQPRVEEGTLLLEFRAPGNS